MCKMIYRSQVDSANFMYQSLYQDCLGTLTNHIVSHSLLKTEITELCNSFSWLFSPKLLYLIQIEVWSSGSCMAICGSYYLSLQ